MRTGDKVVCIDNSPCKVCLQDTGLKLNATYVVYRLKLDEDETEQILYIGLVGDPNCICDDAWMPSYRFRKLDDIKAITSFNLSNSQVI